MLCCGYRGVAEAWPDRLEGCRSAQECLTSACTGVTLIKPYCCIQLCCRQIWKQCMMQKKSAPMNGITCKPCAVVVCLGRAASRKGSSCVLGPGCGVWGGCACAVWGRVCGREQCELPVRRASQPSPWGRCAYSRTSEGRLHNMRRLLRRVCARRHQVRVTAGALQTWHAGSMLTICNACCAGLQEHGGETRRALEVPAMGGDWGCGCTCWKGRRGCVHMLGAGMGDSRLWVHHHLQDLGKLAVVACYITRQSTAV